MRTCLKGRSISGPFARRDQDCQTNAIVTTLSRSWPFLVTAGCPQLWHQKQQHIQFLKVYLQLSTIACEAVYAGTGEIAKNDSVCSLRASGGGLHMNAVCEF